MAAFQKAIDATDRTTSLSFTDSSQPIQVTVGDLSGVSISVSGTWVGSLSFEGSVSGTSWSAIDVHLLSDNSKSATITATGQYGINPTPFSQIRIVPAVASGSALVELLAVKTSSFNWLSAIWKLISDRIPALSNGKIPVEVGSLNVTVGNASLEIANDVGNPIPISDAGGSITVDGSVSISNFPATQVVNTGLTQPLTDAQLRSAPVSVTGTFWQATQPVSAASLPLPTNAATSSLQSTANTSLASIDTKIPALGQALAASSTPVVLPAAQITALTPPTTVNVAPGSAYESTATITRAANTTAYTASDPNFDVYGGLFELQNIGQADKGIFLSFFEISLNLSAVPSGMTSFTVYLYRTAPTSIADNSIWTIGSDPPLDSLGFNVSMSRAKGGGKVVGNIKDLNQLFVLSSTSLWGYIVTNGAFTPAANSETAIIRARSFAP